ncbi:hypothetical protein [Streptomyces sp. NPDC017941]|uniref:hypothetical protein n=1 Tax=Streptomyces sp. NPDC017941 TaxID=3365018 RepID=UPI003789F295
MTDLSMPAYQRGTTPTRRLIAVGSIRRFADRTLTVRVTEAGVTGSITPAPTLSAPVCCGRPMAPRDGQLVCSRCGTWVDPSAAPLAQTFDDDSDDVCPVCGCWICRCGTSRAAAREAVAAR